MIPICFIPLGLLPQGGFYTFHVCLYRDDAEIILLQVSTSAIPSQVLCGYGFDVC